MNIRIEDITLLNILGKGSFGTVFLSRKDGQNCYYATKQIDREKADKPDYQKYFQNELNILRSLNHPNIVHLEDLKVDNKYYYIVMEYINGGSLTDCLKNYQKRNNGKSFPEEIVQYLMRQIVDAVKYLHDKNIIHRDLKLDNIMVSFNNDYDKNNLIMLNSTIKIIDFGLAIELTQNNNVASSVLGTPRNMDPVILKEFVKSKKGYNMEHISYDQKVDIWSLGTICYELYTGKAVFKGKSMEDIASNAENGIYHVPASASREFLSFLNEMLQYDEKKRASIDILSQHPFLVKNCKNFTIIYENNEQNNINNSIPIYLIPVLMTPFPEYPQDMNKINSNINIPRIPQNNYYNNGNYNKSYSYNNNYPYYTPRYSIYGQNMSPNQPPIPDYPNYNQFPNSYTPPFPQNPLPPPYPSGIGGYNQPNYPPYSPAPQFENNFYGRQNSSPPPPQMGYGPHYPNYMPPLPQRSMPPHYPHNYPKPKKDCCNCSIQ